MATKSHGCQGKLDFLKKEIKALVLSSHFFSPIKSTFSFHGSCVWAVGCLASLEMVPFNETRMKGIRHVTQKACAWLPLGLFRKELNVPS